MQYGRYIGFSSMGAGMVTICVTICYIFIEHYNPIKKASKTRNYSSNDHMESNTIYTVIDVSCKTEEYSFSTNKDKEQEDLYVGKQANDDFGQTIYQEKSDDINQDCDVMDGFIQEKENFYKDEIDQLPSNESIHVDENLYEVLFKVDRNVSAISDNDDKKKVDIVEESVLHQTDFGCDGQKKTFEKVNGIFLETKLETGNLIDDSESFINEVDFSQHTSKNIHQETYRSTEIVLTEVDAESTSHKESSFFQRYTSKNQTITEDLDEIRIKNKDFTSLSPGFEIHYERTYTSHPNIDPSQKPDENELTDITEKSKNETPFKDANLFESYDFETLFFLDKSDSLAKEHIGQETEERNSEYLDRTNDNSEQRDLSHEEINKLQAESNQNSSSESVDEVDGYIKGIHEFQKTCKSEQNTREYTNDANTDDVNTDDVNTDDVNTDDVNTDDEIITTETKQRERGSMPDMGLRFTDTQIKYNISTSDSETWHNATIQTDQPSFAATTIIETAETSSDTHVNNDSNANFYLSYVLFEDKITEDDMQNDIKYIEYCIEENQNNKSDVEAATKLNIVEEDTDRLQELEIKPCEDTLTQIYNRCQKLLQHNLETHLYSQDMQMKLREQKINIKNYETCESKNRHSIVLIDIVYSLRYEQQNYTDENIEKINKIFNLYLSSPLANDILLNSIISIMIDIYEHVYMAFEEVSIDKSKFIKFDFQFPILRLVFKTTRQEEEADLIYQDEVDGIRKSNKTPKEENMNKKNSETGNNILHGFNRRMSIESKGVMEKLKAFLFEAKKTNKKTKEIKANKNNLSKNSETKHELFSTVNNSSPHPKIKNSAGCKGKKLQSSFFRR